MRRSALTLVEVCLVLALLIVIASFAIPLLGGAVERRSLISSASLVQASWSKARLAAMESGQTYALRVEPKGSRFQLVSLDQLGLPESQNVPATNPDVDYTPSEMMRLSRNQLPEGVIFAKLDVSSSAQMAAVYGSSGGGPWSQPILFYPDGTTSDASVLLEIESGQTIRVTLRGLTGSSGATEMGRENVQ
jgi:type II secretory pathway pseudopilin PulG